MSTGPAPYHKYKYVIVFFDEFTSRAWTYNLRSKGSAINATRNFLAMVETQYKTKVEAMMSDEGGEYKSKAFLDLLEEKGIKILRSAPYTPQENGHAERFMIIV